MLIVFPRASGTGNLAYTTATYRDQLGIQSAWLRLAWVRCHFVRLQSSGTEIADFSISVDGSEGLGTRFDTKLYTVENAGVGADVNLRIPQNEQEHWIVTGGLHPDNLQFAWTNPDAADIEWALQLAVRTGPIE